MTDNDKIRFAKIMAMLGVAFGSEPSKQLMGIYFEALRPCSIESLEWAAGECVANLKFFPKAAELREFTKISPSRTDPRIVAAREQKKLEILTPPEEARIKLAELAARLNGEFETSFKVEEVNGRPTMVSGKG